ncbi:hypothetical protein [Clostridium perfringens]|uniref:hypothetical protein n=1 Tax=Clostridium perfringens TaxID=1502 RepID=UPI00016BD3BF|nr:hypothetical protein [Clostridium perfringens]EDT26092.1 hypothetical protein AC5_0865 [Clostridium perfringens CPE str. F4969]
MHITLFNSVYNPDTERTEYKRTYLYDVDWQAGKKISEDGKGIISYDLITCFVPFNTQASENKIYKTPGEFINLGAEEVDKYFTFKKGDYIVKGVVDFELTDSNRGNSISKLKNTYEVGTLISIETNDFGSEYLHHWELGAK